MVAWFTSNPYPLSAAVCKVLEDKARSLQIPLAWNLEGSVPIAPLRAYFMLGESHMLALTLFLGGRLPPVPEIPAFTGEITVVDMPGDA